MKFYTTFITFFLLVSISKLTLGNALKPCPENRKNCVSSNHDNKDSYWYITPMTNGYFADNEALAWDCLKKSIHQYSNVKILVDTGEYLHAVFTSKIFQFKDDLEYLNDRKEGYYHYRSASRIGYWDIGQNRRRLKYINAKWTECFIRQLN